MYIAKLLQNQQDSHISYISYSVCCTLLLASSPAPGSSTAAWVRYFTTNFTGLTFLTGYFQARSDSSPLSEWPRITVPVGALHLGLQCWYSAYLRSANRNLHAVPRFRPSTCGRRAFSDSVAGPTVCNPLSPGFYLGHDDQCTLFQTFT